MLLDDNNIKYKKEYTFEDLITKDTNKHLRFDFGVLNNDNNLSYLIEFDGIQHFKNRGSIYDEDGRFERRQELDQIKNEYCKTHNIPLIRIPYTEFETFNIKDLILNTTRFLI